MLKPTSLIMGAGLGEDVASLTDGRFSGGFVVPSSISSHYVSNLIARLARMDFVSAMLFLKHKLVDLSLSLKTGILFPWTP